MKPSRALTGLLASIMALALIAPASQRNNLPRKTDREPTRLAKQRKAEVSLPIKSEGKSVTIFIHGLMVGRFDDKNASEKKFEVGVVKRAPEHNFSLNVYTPGQGKPCEEIPIPPKGTWVFEVQRANGSIRRDIALWSPRTLQAGKGQKSLEASSASRDSGRIMNIEGEYFHQTNLGRHDKPFKRVFHFLTGQIKTESLTARLENFKPEAQVITYKDIGPVAEVVGVEIDLERGERLILCDEKNTTVYWEHKWKATGKVEGRVLNIPPDHSSNLDYCKVPYLVFAEDCPDKRKANQIPLDQFLGSMNESRGPSTSRNAAQKGTRLDDGDDSATHFQFYYLLVFDVKDPERFELKNPSGACHRIFGNRYNRTVKPYRCGMVLVQNRSGEIKE